MTLNSSSKQTSLPNVREGLHQFQGFSSARVVPEIIIRLLLIYWWQYILQYLAIKKASKNVEQQLKLNFFFFALFACFFRLLQNSFGIVQTFTQVRFLYCNLISNKP